MELNTRLPVYIAGVNKYGKAVRCALYLTGRSDRNSRGSPAGPPGITHDLVLVVVRGLRPMHDAEYMHHDVRRQSER